MKINILLLITVFLFFPNLGNAKTSKNLDREISKLTKLSDKQEIKIAKLTARYNEDYAKSKLLKEKGEPLVTSGKIGLVDSLDKYTSYVEQLGNAKDSKTLKQEIKQLKDIQSDWQGFEKNIKSGEKSINKSNDLNLKAIKTNGELNELTKKFKQNKLKIDKLIEQKRLLNSR
jgi:hypothetical protein